MIRPCRRPAARCGSARISSARSKSSSSSLRENCCDSTTCRSRVPIAMKKPPFRPRRTGLKGPFVAAKSTSEVDATLMRHAGQLAEDQRLRGYDAVHLAAPTRLVACTGVHAGQLDGDLRRAASALGYPVFPPAV